MSNIFPCAYLPSLHLFQLSVCSNLLCTIYAGWGILLRFCHSLCYGYKSSLRYILANKFFFLICTLFSHSNSVFGGTEDFNVDVQFFSFINFVSCVVPA